MEVGCRSINVKSPCKQSAKQRHTLIKMHVHGCCHLLFPESYMFMYTLGNLPTMLPAQACWCCSQMGNFQSSLKQCRKCSFQFSENCIAFESDWRYPMPWVVF